MTLFDNKLIYNILIQDDIYKYLNKQYIDYINDDNNYIKLKEYKQYILKELFFKRHQKNDLLYIEKFLILYEQTYKSRIMKEILMDIFNKDTIKKDIDRFIKIWVKIKFPDELSKLEQIFYYSYKVDFLKYKYFIKINNKFYHTEEFEVSFLHYLIFTNNNLNLINNVIIKNPELLNDTNNKYKLHPIHLALLINNFKKFNFLWKKISKNHIKLDLYTIKQENEKLDDNIIDCYGYNILEFSMLNNCDDKIINFLINNFKYNFYQLNKQKENIITILIRVDNEKYYNIFYNLGYTNNDILNGIVYFVQKITNKY